MKSHRSSQRSRPQRSRESREGVVLVTVLMIITLASMTAVYAVQGAAIEIQASGSMKTSMQVKAVSESLVMVGAAAIDELRANGSWSTTAIPDMTRYRLPDITPDGVNSVGGLTLNTDNTQQTATPNEAQLRGPIGLPSGAAVSPFLPSAVAVQETWPRADSQVGDPSQQAVRVAMTIFGELSVPGEAIPAGQVRALHDTISISQSYYDTVINTGGP